jgi:hypothetical protein
MVNTKKSLFKTELFLLAINKLPNNNPNPAIKFLEFKAGKKEKAIGK